MAIKPTPNNNLFKSLVFDGVDSRDYGIYITGDAVFNSPERDVEMIEIPGRNGAYALDKGRFSNIEVSYPAGIAGDTEEDFRKGISAFRNALASRKGYKRLEDDYNPDEYRMAVYKSGLEVTPKALKAGEFTITFDCKPQRFLKSGETAVTIGGSVTNTQTKSGAVVALESDGGDAVTSLVAQIDPVQAGSGDPSPTNVRPITGWTGCNVNVNGRNFLECNVTEAYTAYSGITVTQRGDGSIVLNGTTSSESIPIANFAIAPKGGFIETANDRKRHLPPGTYKWNTGDSRVRIQIVGVNESGGQAVVVDAASGTKVVPDNFKYNWVRLLVTAGTYDNVVLRPFISLASDTDTSYEQYDAKKTDVSFGSVGTIYGGSINPVTGELKSTHAIATYGVGTWSPTPSSIATVGNLTRFWLYVGSGKAWGDASVICDRLQSISNNNYSDSTTQGIGSGAAASATSIWVKLPTADVGTTADSIKAWLLDNPITIVYPLTTPKTYNLTAQQVELLTGDNNVWADTGDITITWGDDPNKLVNPTLYDAHPLLSFTASGSGTITINSDTIAVTNQPIGDIILANVTKLASGESITWSDTGRYQTGDAIRIDSIPAVQTTVVMDSYSYANYTNYISDDMDYLSTASTARGIMIQHSIPSPPKFVAGTARSVAYTARVIDKVKHKTTGDIVDCTTNLTVTIAYDGAHSITVTTTVTASLGTASTTVTIDTVTVNSTKLSLTGTAYVDLDIGEAYSIDGGAVVSINDSVSLGAALPVLKPSVNAISQTGSVANLKVTPRWWEL